MHNSKGMAAMMLIVGIILVLVRLYTTWDIWVVLGILAIIKAIILFASPNCCNQAQIKPSPKKR